MAQTQISGGYQIKPGTIGSTDVDQTQIALKSDLASIGTSPTGTIVMYGGSSAPSGWVLCDGSSYNRTNQTYNNLFSVLQYSYGGSGNQFNVPDLRGRVGIGSGQGTGLTSRTLGQTGGSESHTLSVAEMPNHQHYTQIGIAAEGYALSGANNIYSVGVPTGQVTTAVGGGLAHNNVQPFVAVNYIIKL